MLVNEEFTKILIDLVLSNYRLGKAEYDRNISYNTEHFHYKAEKAIMEYLRDNEPILYSHILHLVSMTK